MDNSFLVEEAFNQEAGVFQNIFGAARRNGHWGATFTQEWPVVAHDASVLVHRGVRSTAARTRVRRHV